MAPLVPTFHTSHLPAELNTLPNGKPRKGPPVRLSDCALKELVQYKCDVPDAEGDKKKGKRPMIVCEPVVRLFRVCADGMKVETNAWEAWREKQRDTKTVGV